MRLLIGKYPPGAPPTRRDDWTDFSDIGRRFSGNVFKLREYCRVENLYVDFVLSLLDSLGHEHVRVSEPRLTAPLPAWLPEFHNGTELEPTRIAAVLRAMLRGDGVGCVMESADSSLRVGVGFDYYLTIDAMEDELGRLVRESIPHGLYVSHEEESPREEYVTTLADDTFWSNVMESALAQPKPLWILEGWAYGAWGERWYRACGHQLDEVRDMVSPSSVIRVYSDMEVEVVDLASCFDESTRRSANLLHVRFFDYPPGGIELFAQPVFGSMAGQGFGRITGPVGIFWPDEVFVEGPLLEAVAPDRDGLLRAHWLTSPTSAPVVFRYLGG